MKEHKLRSLIISSGVAFHHGGLTTHDRNLVEHGFKTGVIGVICCTTTLAAGVNLPVRRVILASLFTGMEPLDVRLYRQICGRAGRVGFHDQGEAFLIAGAGESLKAAELMMSPLTPVTSALATTTTGTTSIADKSNSRGALTSFASPISSKITLERLILDAIGLELARTVCVHFLSFSSLGYVV
jgi:replicative superfamily II helicase